MSNETVADIFHAAKLRTHIVTSSVAYAVSAIEGDPAPTFQLGTAVRMGLSDDEVRDPATISRMKWEYRAWVVGHALADISESIATLLNELVRVDAKAFGYGGQFEKFERLGLDRKLNALPALTLDSDYRAAIDSITRARNCLVHRHGIVGKPDCNDAGDLVLTWRGIELFQVKPEGLMVFDPSHRGPALQQNGAMVKVLVTGIERRFPRGSRLDLEPSDLCTLSWCISGITAAIEAVAGRLLGNDSGRSSQSSPAT